MGAKPCPWLASQTEFPCFLIRVLFAAGAASRLGGKGVSVLLPETAARQRQNTEEYNISCGINK
jgi:hypothetical protein